MRTQVLPTIKLNQLVLRNPSQCAIPHNPLNLVLWGLNLDTTIIQSSSCSFNTCQNKENATYWSPSFILGITFLEKPVISKLGVSDPHFVIYTFISHSANSWQLLCWCEKYIYVLSSLTNVHCAPTGSSTLQYIIYGGLYEQYYEWAITV